MPNPNNHFNTEPWYALDDDARSAVAYAATDRAVRQYAPDALDTAGLTAEATALRSLAPIVDKATAEAAWSAAESAGNAAGNAAWYAARDAADAAWRAADAAGYAARNAAWRAADAAGSAAWYASEIAANAADAEKKLQHDHAIRLLVQGAL